MDNYATVSIEELDGDGQPWRILTSHMVRSNVGVSLAAVRAGYNMKRTRLKVDGKVVEEPRRSIASDGFARTALPSRQKIVEFRLLVQRRRPRLTASSASTSSDNATYRLSRCLQKPSPVAATRTTGVAMSTTRPAWTMARG